MLGQAHRAQRRALLLAAVVIAVLVAPALSGAIPSHGASTLRLENSDLAQRSRAAVLQVYALDHRLASASTQLGSLEQQAASLREQRSVLARQVRIAQRGSRLTESQLGEQLRELYEQGDVEPLEIVFGSRSLDEAMASLDGLSRMSGRAEDVLQQLKATRATLDAEAKALASREAALAAAIREAAATRAALAQAQASKQAYIAQLSKQRRLNEQQIASLLAQAQAAQVRSARVNASTAPASTADVATTPAGRRTLSVSASAYSLPGHTSSGLPVGWGVVAVDPSLIPLGTHMTIPGYGEAIAADTGTAIIGPMIDIWFPTLAQAQAWGRKTITITLH